MSRTAAPFRLPAVPHVIGTAWHDEIVHRTEKHVAASERHSAIFDGGEIDQFTRLYFTPIGQDDSVNPKPRNAAVRKNIEPHVRPCLVIRDLKNVL